MSVFGVLESVYKMKNMHMISPLEHVYDVSVREETVCTEPVKQEQINAQPMFGPYQLIGDSLFVRFAEHILEQQSKIVNGFRTIGYCISGQRIDQLRQRIEKGGYHLTDQIMILIGTNDVLCGGEPEIMIKQFKRLLRVLQQKSVNRIVIITLPPIPKLCVSFSHWGIIRKYNEFLKTLKNERSMDIEVVDVLPIFTIFKPALTFKITKADLTFNRSKNLERNGSLENDNTFEIKSEKQNCVERQMSWPETPVSRESSVERKVLIQSRETISQQESESIKNENSTPTLESSQKEKNKARNKRFKRRIVAEFSSDSNNESEKGANSSEECAETQNFELHRAQEIIETPTVLKGTKRLSDIATHDDEIVAFNSALNRGSSKKRKIEYVSPIELQSPETKQVRKSVESNAAQTSIFFKALEGIEMQTSAKRKVHYSSNFKVDSERERNEGHVVDDSWAADTDEENLDSCHYFSQEEEEINYDNEARRSENKVFRQSFSEFLKSTNKSNFPKASETKFEGLKGQFSNFLNGTNNLNFPKTSSPIADQGMYSSSEYEYESEYEIENILEARTVCNFSEGKMKIEPSENEMKDDLYEGETADDSSESEKNDDLSESETKNDSSDDGVGKGEAETESENEVVTTDDEVRKKQIIPIVDSKFIEYLNSVPKYSRHSENERNMDYLSGSFSPVCLNPRDKFSRARNLPRLMDNILYGGISRGPYLHSMTPPLSAPPTPPPLSVDEICEPSESPYDCLLPRDKLIIEYSRRICDVNCYEEFYTVGSRRMDMIHLNHAGLIRLQNFIEDQNIFF